MIGIKSRSVGLVYWTESDCEFEQRDLLDGEETMYPQDGKDGVIIIHPDRKPTWWHRDEWGNMIEEVLGT